MPDVPTLTPEQAHAAAAEFLRDLTAMLAEELPNVAQESIDLDDTGQIDGEVWLLEAGFTGQIQTKSGQTWYYRDGVRVPGPHDQEPAPRRPGEKPLASTAGRDMKDVAADLLRGQVVIGKVNLSLKRGRELLTALAPALASGNHGKLSQDVKDYLKQTFGRVPIKSQGKTKAVAELLGGGKEDAGQPERGRPGSEPGGAAAAQPPEAAGGGMEKETPGPVPGGGDQGGADAGKPAGQEAPGNVPGARIPASQHEVNRRLDRFEKLFREKGQAQVADWMGLLRNHVNEAGTDAALAALGEEVRGEKKYVQYEGGWDNMGDFAEAYLNRNGITPLFIAEGAEALSPEQAEKHSPLISSMTPDDQALNRRAAGDFTPSDPSWGVDKLREAQHLPGLESSEDLGKLMGKEEGSPVTHLTQDVVSKMDEKYGKDGWIIKPYGKDAFAGMGIYFPQRAAQIRQEAQNTLWSAGEQVAKHGFTLKRDDKGKVVGLKHQGGDEYDFGTDRYNHTIGGDVRHWADRAAEAAHHEQGAMLPIGGKEFMAQPAFEVVGVSEADRAAGKTIAPGEGRVHVVARGGKVEVIPHTTWIKNEWLPVVFESEETKAMAAAAQKAIEALPESERSNHVYAPDIVKTKTGYKVVEANPAAKGGGSGYLGNAQFVIDSYVSHLTNREAAHVGFIRKLLSSRKKQKAG